MREEPQGRERLPKQLFLGYAPSHGVWAKFPYSLLLEILTTSCKVGMQESHLKQNCLQCNTVGYNFLKMNFVLKFDFTMKKC